MHGQDLGNVEVDASILVFPVAMQSDTGLGTAHTLCLMMFNCQTIKARDSGPRERPH